MQVEAVDLFCGVGGLSYGMSDAGINVTTGYDIDPACRYAYTENNSAKFQLGDIRDLQADDIKNQWESRNSVKVLAGCAPCQPFSTMQRSTSKHARNHDKWDLLLEFQRLATAINPDYVTIENVPGLIRQPIYRQFMESLKRDGYHVTAKVLSLRVLGLPQTRKRLVLIASRTSPVDILTPRPKYLNVQDAIKHLPPIPAGGNDTCDPLHRAQNLSKKNIERIKSSTPGGTWKDWPEDLLLDCHKRSSGKNYGSTYGRMEWDKPAPTMTTQFYNYGSGRFGHPTQDRALSLREGALIQGFPDHYKFEPEGETDSFQNVGRLIGNAVPPLLGKLVGSSIMHQLRGISAPQ